MSLTPGTRLGVYQIIAAIGEGGMGQVFRARDTTLDRDVAIKILPEAFAHDADRLARFTREAKTLASLNHPHIAAIYGLEKFRSDDRSGGSSDPPITALVMELVEGEDLSQRIARGAIPIDEALPIAKQIAEALEAAHEQGIIHRDLKPANIKVRPDGTVKVLDFGLAKAMEPGAGGGRPGGDVSQSPTITTPAMTQAGMILGTAAYMAPEQARGKTVDKRADIWAFGAVLYEMLTAHRAFGGEDVSDTLANVLKTDPAWERLPAEVPARIRQVLRSCLQRDTRQRLGDMQSVRLALDGAFETAAAQSTATTATSRGRLFLMASLAVTTLLIAAMAVPVVRHLRETLPPVPFETRLAITTPANADPTSFALSPDGRQIVFVASDDGPSGLWLRSLTSTTAQALTGTDGAKYPFWSPDGRSVAFFADNWLKRLDLNGNQPPIELVRTGARGGTWNADGVIVYGGVLSSLSRVSASGGPAAAVTTLDGETPGHRFPWFLPDGRRFLFFAVGNSSGIYLGELDGSAPTLLTPSDGAGVFLPAGSGPADARGDGWLLWVRAGTLVAQRLDLQRKALVEAPVTLSDSVPVDTFFASAVSASAAGPIAYRAGGASRRQLEWFDRSGTPLGTLGAPDDQGLSDPVLSPDGRQVAVVRRVQGNQDIWLLDGSRMTRFTFDPRPDRYPVWSRDGRWVVFSSNRKEGAALRSAKLAGRDIYRKLSSGAGAEDLLLESPEDTLPRSMSPDDHFLLYEEAGSSAWVLPMVGTRTPSVVMQSVPMQSWSPGPRFSPDGRWVAYASGESGRSEIYVRPFVPPVGPNSAAGPAAVAGAGQWQVSTAGGTFPVWRHDGTELYYLNPSGAMMAAPVTVTGNALAPGAPSVLFPTRIYGGGVNDAQGRQYDVAPDGRFLINTVVDEATAPITLIQNWNPEPKK